MEEEPKPEKKNKLERKLVFLIIFSIIFLGIFVIGIYLYSNQDLFKQGWEFVEFKKIGENEFKITRNVPLKTYITKKDGEKAFVVYPEINLGKSPSGYGWIKKINVDVLENLTIEIKFFKDYPISSSFILFILKREDESYPKSRFSFIYNVSSDISELKYEDNFINLKLVLNISDICIFFNNYVRVECPISGRYDFYFGFVNAGNTPLLVKQVKLLDEVLLAV